MENCNIAYDEGQRLSWLCSDSTTEGLPSSFIGYRFTDPPFPASSSCFNRWKKSKLVGVARIRYLVCLNEELTVVTEDYPHSFEYLIQQKLRQWRERRTNIRLTHHNSRRHQKVSWWRFIAGFIIRHIGQVRRLLSCMYSKNPREYHGCICRDCISFNAEGELGMRLYDPFHEHNPTPALDRANMDRDFNDLKSLIEGILLEPFGNDTNIDEFSLPHDLSFFLEALGRGAGACDWTRVSLEFFMDRPLFWTPEEKRNFYTLFHDATFANRYLQYKQIRSTVASLSLPLKHWEKWIRPKEVALTEIRKNSDYSHNNCSRYTRNVDHHFKEHCAKAQKSWSRSAVLNRVTSSCPYFHSLPEYIREAVMIRASNVVQWGQPNHGNWIWAQTQLLSTKVEVDPKPYNVNADPRFQQFPLPR